MGAGTFWLLVAFRGLQAAFAAGLVPSVHAMLREVVPDDVMLPRMFVAFRSPVFGSDGYYVASVTSAILGLKKGSRLHRALVREQQVAAEATAFTYDLAKGSDLLVVDVTARPETSTEALEIAVHMEIDRLHNEGVTEEEVARAVALNPFHICPSAWVVFVWP